jgi:hypothetical protein
MGLPWIEFAGHGGEYGIQTRRTDGSGVEPPSEQKSTEASYGTSVPR